MVTKGFPAPAGATGTGKDAASAPVAVPRLPQYSRQPRRGMVALGVLVVAGSGLLSFQLVSTLNERVPVVLAARDVPVGQRIGPADVTTAMVGADDRVAKIPGRRLRQVVGKVAAVDVRRGSVMPPTAITDGVTPSAGQQLVPVAVKPSRLPARGLQPGDPVLVIEAGDGQGAAAPENPPPGKKPAEAADGHVKATVNRVTGSPDADGLIVVDLLVTAADGPWLARLAADGRVAFSLDSRGR